MEIRIQSTGQVMTEDEFRRANAATSFPQVLTSSLLASFGADPVLNGPQPVTDRYHMVMRDGVEQINGKWFTRYRLGPDHASPEDEAAWRASIDAEAALAFKSAVVAAAEARLNDFAKTRGYDGILSACTYATSTVPQFAAEGTRCVALRDQTWATLSEILAAVEAGTKLIPENVDTVLANMPSLTWE